MRDETRCRHIGYSHLLAARVLLYTSSHMSSSVVRAFAYGAMDRSFMGDPLGYFSFQPVPYDWCKKGRGMCCPVCGMVHIKESVLLIGTSSPCSGGSGFPLSRSCVLLVIRCFSFFKKGITIILSLVFCCHKRDDNVWP